MSSNVDASQRGLTLFELLVALAVLSTATLGVSGMLNRVSPSFELRAIASALASDLKRTRAAALSSGEWRTVSFSDNAYAASDLGIKKTLSESVSISVQGNEQNRVSFFEDGSSTGAEIVISKRGAAYRVSVNAITGRVSVDAS